MAGASSSGRGILLVFEGKQSSPSPTTRSWCDPAVASSATLTGFPGALRRVAFPPPCAELLRCCRKPGLRRDPPDPIRRSRVKYGAPNCGGSLWQRHGFADWPHPHLTLGRRHRTLVAIKSPKPTVELIRPRHGDFPFFPLRRFRASRVGAGASVELSLGMAVMRDRDLQAAVDRQTSHGGETPVANPARRLRLMRRDSYPRQPFLAVPARVK
ncbi:hypothetical protein JHW43_000188 [Diplocarpon mali]|nr:hypothetical protein JHW43_000188 [Diplocarpon mali]